MTSERNNVIVTGANGYLGSHLVRTLTAKGYNVWAIVRSEDSDISRIRELDHCQIVICPMEEIDTLSGKVCDEISACFHLAWPSGSKLRAQTMLSQESLIRDCLRLMDVVYDKGCRRFVGVGTILETNAAFPLARHPNMVYAVTKDYTNKLLTLRARELNVNYTWCRLCGLYGGADETGNLISYTISNLKNGVSPEYSEGSQPYSFIHVDDCANALVCIGESALSVPSPIIISGPECMTIRQYVEIAQAHIAPGVPIRFGVRPDDGIRYDRSMFDNTYLRETLGFRYKHYFEDEMDRQVNR